MKSSVARAIGRGASKAPLALPIVQKRFAATILQKPKIVDLSRELYHRCPNHPFHVPFVSPQSHKGLLAMQSLHHNTDSDTMGHLPAQSRRQRYFTLRLLRANNV